jgi:serine/threonine-protein kinase
MTASVGSVVGSHRLEAVIGAGPAGVVYRAAHLRLGRLAAVKMLAPAAGEDEHARARFLEQVNATAGIDHPSVIPILDAGVHEDEAYVVMRYVGGGDLKGLIARVGALDADLLTAVLGPVAGALDAAHEEGVVHGDVKPSNVLLEWSRDGSVRHVYLSDFGMAARVPPDEGLSRVGPLVDRFDYLAPEQVEEREVGPAADVYALGCVAFHALTGRAPFGGRFGGAVLHGRGAEGVEPPSTLRPSLPEAVDDPVLRALEEEPGRRFAAAGDLMRAVGAAFGGAGAGGAGAATQAGSSTGFAAAFKAAAPAPHPPEVAAPPRPAAAPPPQAAAPPPPPPAPAEAPSPAQAEAPPPAAAARSAASPSEAVAPPPQEVAAPPPVPPPRPAAEAPPPAEPPPSDAGEPDRRRRRLLTVTLPVVAVTIVAGIVGYIIASGGGGDDSGEGQQAGAAAATTAEPLRAIADRDLRDQRCTTTSIAGGADVLANATCVPKEAQGAAARRVSLTLFSSREALDQVFLRSRRLAQNSTSGAAGCPTGRWYRDAAGTRPGGRSFCGPGGVRIVWTDEDALVLAEAVGPRPDRLAAWWQDRRDLKAGNQG